MYFKKKSLIIFNLNNLNKKIKSNKLVFVRNTKELLGF